MSFARRLALTVLAVSFLSATPVLARQAEPREATGVFLARPYLQPGLRPAPGAVSLAWHVEDTDARWTVEYRSGSAAGWKTAEAPSSKTVAVEGIAPFRIVKTALAGMEPGSPFLYVVSKDGRPVFRGDGVAPHKPGQPRRFVVFGDIAAGSDEQKTIAYQASLLKPDYVVVTGDIVYDRGRVSEYRDKFWNVYNNEAALPSVGAPLLRSSLFIAAPGNHDTATRDLDRFPDALAYYYFWDQPLNGPEFAEGSAVVPALTASPAHRKAFVDAAGPAYPRMANFSLDEGEIHWTILDSNPYVDWSDGTLRDWLARDLAAAKDATWKFVVFHHPGFQSSRTHYAEQHMRQIAGILESAKVDIVFNGHVHNYQRSLPMKAFAAGGDPMDRPLIDKSGQPITRGRLIPGRWTLDKVFDGVANTRPDGVIYLVTGAGGQHLYDPEQEDQPETWQDFTHKFVSRINSLTVADLEGKTLTIRQIGGDGRELDRFVITK